MDSSRQFNILAFENSSSKMLSLRNEQLKTILPDWPGTPLDEEGRFVNLHKPFKSSLAKVLR
ncbi:MAG: hypothetical protein H7Z75_09615 [Ferruginibacter sp.]|nr:hypothetical protein [Cytophagales bacterium]